MHVVTITAKRQAILPVALCKELGQFERLGNVRELRNVLERPMILSPGPVLLLEEIAADPRTRVAVTAGEDGVRTLADVERDYILRVVEWCDWRIRGPGSAAKLLGLNASTLYSRLKKLGIRRSTATRHRQVGG